MRLPLAVPLALLALSGCVGLAPDSGPPDFSGPPDIDSTGGLFLLAPTQSRSTWLVDGAGVPVHRWESGWLPGMAAYLGDDGTLIRAGRGGAGLNPQLGSLPGAGGVIEQFDWDGDVQWSWTVSDSAHLAHHDVHQLPNGNVLLLVWEVVAADEAIALGRDPETAPEAGLVSDAIWELDPSSGEIVWRWSALDHLVQDQQAAAPEFAEPRDRPGRVDLNAGDPSATDWLHFNGLDHDPVTDRIAVSVHGLGEVWVLDHAISTEEAAGPAGDLLFRWGNPEAWGGLGGRELYGHHDPTWLDSGRLLIFDNGRDRPGGEYSRLVELELPLDQGALRPPAAEEPPPSPAWTWTAPEPTDLVALFMSGAQRLPNGDTLLTDGPGGRLLQITSDGDILWEYDSPFVADGMLAPGSSAEQGATALFNTRRYEMDGPELQDVELIPLRVDEIGPEVAL